MSQSANVLSIDAISQWKADLCVFRAEGREALGATALEVRHAFDWLQERQGYWLSEVRRREDKVFEAKSELTRRKTLVVTVDGRQPDCTFQEKALRKAQDYLAAAQDKLAATRKWQTALQIEVNEYETQSRRLDALLDSDLARALVLLEQKMQSLEAYVALPGRVAPSIATTQTTNDKKVDKR